MKSAGGGALVCNYECPGLIRGEFLQAQAKGGVDQGREGKGLPDSATGPRAHGPRGGKC